MGAQADSFVEENTQLEDRCSNSRKREMKTAGSTGDTEEKVPMCFIYEVCKRPNPMCSKSQVARGIKEGAKIVFANVKVMNIPL